jgi:hypothetical protein
LEDIGESQHQDESDENASESAQPPSSKSNQQPSSSSASTSATSKESVSVWKRPVENDFQRIVKEGKKKAKEAALVRKRKRIQKE